MSQVPEEDAATRGGGFDPKRFFELVRNVGHGRALALEYRDSADNWIELALPWKSQTAPSIEVFDRSTINPLDITKTRSSRGVNFLLEHVL